MRRFSPARPCHRPVPTFIIALGSRWPLGPTQYDALIYVFIGRYLALLTRQLATHPRQIALDISGLISLRRSNNRKLVVLGVSSRAVF
jgi:hypothetical protein